MAITNKIVLESFRASSTSKDYFLCTICDGFPKSEYSKT